VISLPYGVSVSLYALTRGWNAEGANSGMERRSLYTYTDAVPTGGQETTEIER